METLQIPEYKERVRQIRTLLHNIAEFWKELLQDLSGNSLKRASQSILKRQKQIKTIESWNDERHNADLQKLKQDELNLIRFIDILSNSTNKEMALKKLEKDLVFQGKLEEIKEKRNYREILTEEVSENYLKSKHITSAFYYSDSFLNKELPILIKKYPEFKYYHIINDINKIQQSKPELRNKYINMLLSKCEDAALDFSKIVQPLKELKTGKGHNHSDAVDYFIAEGSPIFAINAGVVVAIENNWSKENIGNNTSEKGGNFVIIFNPKTKEFSRYCHMESTSGNIKVGEIIPAGTEIGKVGHTGLNANKKGHGEHLHIEINKVKDNGAIVSLSDNYIKKKLSRAINLK